jgi:hypothetical protein
MLGSCGESSTPPLDCSFATGRALRGPPSVGPGATTPTISALWRRCGGEPANREPMSGRPRGTDPRRPPSSPCSRIAAPLPTSLIGRIRRNRIRRPTGRFHQDRLFLPLFFPRTLSFVGAGYDYPIRTSTRRSASESFQSPAESFEFRCPDRAVHRAAAGRRTILSEASCMGDPTSPTADTSEFSRPPNPN